MEEGGGGRNKSVTDTLKTLDYKIQNPQNSSSTVVTLHMEKTKTPHTFCMAIAIKALTDTDFSAHCEQWPWPGGLQSLFSLVLYGGFPHSVISTVGTAFGTLLIPSSTSYGVSEQLLSRQSPSPQDGRHEVGDFSVLFDVDSLDHFEKTGGGGKMHYVGGVKMHSVLQTPPRVLNVLCNCSYCLCQFQ